jgi:tRNA-dihydrouridine synthase B
MVTVHGRTRCQFYTGKADWKAISRVRDAISIPLVANGDVDTATDVEQILCASGADAVMIGRAAQGRPWHVGALAGNANIPQTVEQVAMIADEHFRMTLEHYGAGIGVRHFRKHLGWYLDRHAPDCPQGLRASIMTTTDPSAVMTDFALALEGQSSSNLGDRKAA